MCVEVETINKCNGGCSFCPNNRRETAGQPVVVMEDAVFDKIVSELAERDFNGIFFFNGNNEPFLDRSICDRIAYTRERLPRATLEVFTNGSLLTNDILDRIAGKLDTLLINNYSTEYRLNEGSKLAVDHYLANRERYGGMKIIIEYRYSDQILTNRGGDAPNKPNKTKVYKSRCVVPFEEALIYADGVMGLCCNDTRRRCELGSVKDTNIYELFNSPRFTEIRRQLAQGRDRCEYCKHCDFESRGQRGVVWIKKYADRLGNQKS